MPFRLSGPPEEAAAQLCRHLGLHQKAHRELIENDDGSFNCRKCSDDTCPYNKLGDALSDLSASASLDQRLAEVERKLSETLLSIRQMRQQEEHRKADR